MNEDLEIPLYVIEALEAVRSSGRHNMHFAADVFREMYNMEYYDAVLWLGRDIIRKKINEFGEEEEMHYFAVDLKKYSPALQELGQIRSLADYLSKN